MGWKGDEIGCIEELKVFFEILVIICVEKHFSMKAFKAYLLERDGRSCYVLGEILPLLLASAEQSY